jgi:hypothetical protein
MKRLQYERQPEDYSGSELAKNLWLKMPYNDLVLFPTHGDGIINILTAAGINGKYQIRSQILSNAILLLNERRCLTIVIRAIIRAYASGILQESSCDFISIYWNVQFHIKPRMVSKSTLYRRKWLKKHLVFDQNRLHFRLNIPDLPQLEKEIDR